jgi:hypothetical protein
MAEQKLAIGAEENLCGGDMCLAGAGISESNYIISGDDIFAARTW